MLQDRVESTGTRRTGYKFFAEAKRLWEVERMEEASLTTLRSAIVISILYNMYSMDNVVMTYSVQPVTMAKELNLFGTPAVTDSRMRNAHDHTAWCLFCWNKQVSLLRGLVGIANAILAFEIIISWPRH